MNTAPGAPRTPRRATGSERPPRWYLKVTALATAIVALIAVDAYLLVMREQTTPVGVLDAVERYRTPRHDPLDAPAPPGEPERETASTHPTAADTSAPAVEATSQNASLSGPESSTTQPAPSSTPPLPRPKPGVYVYATDGYEEVSLLDNRRDYPEETTRTIRHREGCEWSMRITFLEEHEEEHVACSSASRIEVLASSTSVEWFGRRQDNVFACDPPQRLVDRDAAPGATATFVCREGDRTQFEGTVTHRGGEGLTVNGERRDAWRIEVSSTSTGEIRGTVEVDQLIDQATGHVLWEHRHDELDQDTQAGTVHYRQTVTSTLTGLDPRT